MRRFLLGLQLLSLCGAVAGAVLTWPKGANDPARISPTLSEFQTGVRISLLSDAAKQPSPASAAQPERMQRSEARVAPPPAQAVEDAGPQPDSGKDTLAQTYRVASTGSLQQMLSVGENVPEADPPRLPVSHATPDEPRHGDLLREAIVLASTELAQPVTLAVAKTPEPGPPDVSTRPSTIAYTVRQDDVSTESPGAAVETEKPRARNPDDPGTNVSYHTRMTIRHVEHISIHYHGDTRSRTDAQHISDRLGSSGLSAVEMHTTAHIMPIPLVRYFSRRDAPAAIALAEGLGSKPTNWHVDDCTAYRHKPERGTIQIWPATARMSP